MTDTKTTAAALRKHLRQAWPTVRFSVRMDRGTAAGWIGCAWTDGPTEAQVQQVTHQYRCRGILTHRHLSDEAQTWAGHHDGADARIIATEPVTDWGYRAHVDGLGVSVNDDRLPRTSVEHLCRWLRQIDLTGEDTSV